MTISWTYKECIHKFMMWEMKQNGMVIVDGLCSVAMREKALIFEDKTSVHVVQAYSGTAL